MARKFGLLCLVGLLGLSSCVTFEKYSIEVFKPSSYSFPSYVRTVGIVSRNLKYTTDTLQNYYSSNGKLRKDQKPLGTDLLARQICLDSLARKLNTQNRFDSIWVVPADAVQEKRVNEIRPAVNDWYQTLADRNGADALVLLDMFSCFYNIDDAFENPQVNVVTSNIWSVYDAHTGKIADRYLQIDTLYWNGYDENGNFRKIRLPGKKEAIKLSAAVIASDYARHIVPDWTLVYREIMTNTNPELEVASTLAKKGEWAKAQAVWQEIAEKPNKKNRAIAFYNLALSGEMDGDLEKAQQYCTKAASESTSFFLKNVHQATKAYAAILFKRKIELEKLNAQHEDR